MMPRMANETRRPMTPPREDPITTLVKSVAERGVHIHLHIHEDASDDSNIGPLLQKIFTELRALRVQGVNEMATVKDVQDKLAELQTSVEGETELSEAVKVLLEGQTTLLADLKRQLEAAIAANDPAALQAVVDAMGTITQTNTSNAEKIAAAVVANTPAAEPPPDAPAGRSRR